MSDDVSRWLTEILISLGIVFGFVILGRVLIFLLDRVVRKLTVKTATDLDDMLLDAVEKPSFYLLVLWGAYIAFHRLDVQLGQGAFHVADSAVFILAVALLVKLAYDVINALLGWYALTLAHGGREDVGKTVMPLVKKVVKVFVILSGVIVVLDHLDYSISSLVAALGVSSLAVGLAAKDSLANMISGFIIMVDRPFRVGDRIDVGGRVGEVTDIGLRSTKIRTLDNTIVILPNSRLVDDVVLNYAYPENSIKHYYKIGVEYGSDIGKVREVLLEIASGIPEIMDEPAPGVYFTDHADSSLEFHLLYWINDYTKRWTVLDKVNTAVNRRFAEEGIGMAFPTRTLHVYHEDGA